MHMLFVVLLKMLEASSNFHKYYPRQTKLLVFLLLKLALSAVSQAQALLQILPLLVCLPRDTVLDPVSNFLGDRVLDRSMYAQIHLYRTKTPNLAILNTPCCSTILSLYPDRLVPFFQKPCFVQ